MIPSSIVRTLCVVATLVGCGETRSSNSPTAPAAEDAVLQPATDPPEQAEALAQDDAVIVVRVIPRGEGVPDDDAMKAQFEAAKGKMLAHEGLVATTLLGDTRDQAPYRYVTLTAWASTEHLSAAAPDLGVPDAYAQIGWYQAKSTRGREGRPATGRHVAFVTFPEGADEAAVLQQVEGFDQAASKFEGWDGAAVFTAVGGSPKYPILSLTSWESMESAQAFHRSPEVVELMKNVLDQDGENPAGMSILQLLSR